MKFAKANGTIGFTISGGDGPLTLYLQTFAVEPAQVDGLELSNAVELVLLP